jgi:hypothetical protein
MLFDMEKFLLYVLHWEVLERNILLQDVQNKGKFM